MPIRCLQCGAQNADGADWCNQCYQSLVSATPKVPTSTPTPTSTPGLVSDDAERLVSELEELVASAVPSAETEPDVGERKTAVWTCPVCDEGNSIDAIACTTCGTSIHAAFTPPEETVEPGIVKAWSVLPGGGHMKANAAATGVAILLLALMGLGFGLALLNAEATRVIGFLILMLGGVVWVGSAYDVQRHLDTGADWLFRPRVISGMAGAIIALLLLGVLLAI